MTIPDRHVGELTDKDREFCTQVAQLAKARRIPFGRAVFLFGQITRAMTEHAVNQQGADADEAIYTYISHFMTGMGAESVEMNLDVQLVKQQERH